MKSHERIAALELVSYIAVRIRRVRTAMPFHPRHPEGTTPMAS
jgi:hypothetical protein